MSIEFPKLFIKSEFLQQKLIIFQLICNPIYSSHNSITNILTFSSNLPLHICALLHIFFCAPMVFSKKLAFFILLWYNKM